MYQFFLNIMSTDETKMRRKSPALGAGITAALAIGGAFIGPLGAPNLTETLVGPSSKRDEDLGEDREGAKKRREQAETERVLRSLVSEAVSPVLKFVRSQSNEDLKKLARLASSTGYFEWGNRVDTCKYLNKYFSTMATLKIQANAAELEGEPSDRITKEALLKGCDADSLLSILKDARDAGKKS